MRIAQIAPLWERVPPPAYGGIELVVGLLCNELVRRREPFGLVMIESMVTGTPIIAMNLGSTAEIIAHGKTGFLCNSVDECVAALDRVAQLNRYECRQQVIDNFSVQKMTQGAKAVYQQILAKRFSENGHLRSVGKKQLV